MHISFTEENYLKSILSLNLSNNGTEVSTTQLSDKLGIRAASITDMLKRLADKKLIHYKKYHGVELTKRGEKMAVSIVRKHRLWEVFLMEKLGFRWDEVHELAEQLEHIQSDELIARLDNFLGNPKHDPHGDPIPDKNGQWIGKRSRALIEFNKKGAFIFTGVCEHSPAFLQHISSMGLKLGDVLQIEEVNSFDASFTIKAHKKTLFLSSKVAANLLVEVKK